MTTATQERRSIGDRLLTTIERWGNKLPEPFTLFLVLLLITGVVSTAMALADVAVTVPGTEDGPIEIRGLFTGEGLAWFTSNLGPNFIGFPPLQTVLTILLAVGVAEKTGMLAAVVRKSFGSAPRWMLPYVVGIVGVTGSVMADSAFIIIPPLAALVFKAAGRHPVAGLLGGFAAVGAGYSTALVPTSLDALFAGITTGVMESLPGIETTPVNPVSNYYFNVVAALLLGLVCGFIIDRILEPRMVTQDVPTAQVDAGEEAAERGGAGTAEVTGDETGRGRDARGDQAVDVEAPNDADTSGDTVDPELSAVETRALWWSLAAAGLLTVVVLAALLVPGSPWRNEEGGFLPSSPLLDSIVFLVFAYFMTMGVVYGRVVGTVSGMSDIVRMMSSAVKDMMSFLILAFVLGQFIALFNWTGIGAWIAVNGAAGLEASGLTGFPAVLGFILLASCLNLFIVSGSSMWTIMAAVFVPMFALIGLEPAFTQAAFRVGDSATQVITPLNPYMIVILGLLRRYEPDAGLGTVIARLIVFVVPFWVSWATLVGIWYFFDLPLGPGNGIFLR
ncbi:P-aminobenzoyl-glutamate transporter [Serinicoccus chungangensis]|uniref:p-aminobenzoyl-glutamate transporter n=1 Tax=Serinicoccus chungangensis TaxID=767452 RepID=A0A0W8I9Z5_9MICO|nr:AbgT family transporter [Serinicoccus chungangensis]KUG56753.1 P-aminobenzoyl-glutamate transporter [Serinicoccus chungangensis]